MWLVVELVVDMYRILQPVWYALTQCQGMWLCSRLTAGNSFFSCDYLMGLVGVMLIICRQLCCCGLYLVSRGSGSSLPDEGWLATDKCLAKRHGATANSKCNEAQHRGKRHPLYVLFLTFLRVCLGGFSCCHCLPEVVRCDSSRSVSFCLMKSGSLVS